eukprot:TRINITY_DN24647_c0_g1_i1.p1 TRINITY_DN24647_c0_g1~~TRINITY_DN24647_c0_g1_i1.p1  ORF type:complete len:387 (-),score=79.45 TRINITY_DN24647_c0_g1_i1:245-1405(-)
MWHGTRLRLHEGGCAFLVGLTTDLEGEECEVVRFCGKAKKWAVRLADPALAGKEVLVKEKHVSFTYAVLPTFVDKARDAHFCVKTGLCGRHLVATASFSKGQCIFSECPFLVSAAYTSSCKSRLAGSPQAWAGRARWEAFLHMQRGARSEADMRQALQWFQGLSSSNRQGNQSCNKAKEVRKEAEEIFNLMDDPPPDRHMWLHAISDVLFVWWTNQIEFPNGSEQGASALFRWVSLMNHSCCPSVHISCSAVDQDPGNKVAADGRILANAVCDISVGSELGFNYGPEELLQWSLEKRRKHLLENYGFLCCCQRCSAEERGENLKVPTKAAHHNKQQSGTNVCSEEVMEESNGDGIEQDRGKLGQLGLKECEQSGPSQNANFLEAMD